MKLSDKDGGSPSDFLPDDIVCTEDADILKWEEKGEMESVKLDNEKKVWIKSVKKKREKDMITSCSALMAISPPHAISKFPPKENLFL